jgi:alpha-amylase
MKSIVFCLHLNLPERLRPVRYCDRLDSYFEPVAPPADQGRLGQSIEQINEALIGLIHASHDKLYLALHISGSMLELLCDSMSTALESFKALLRTGQVELTGGPYYQSLACLFSQEEFRIQVLQHADALQSLFGSRPPLLLNSGLIYTDELEEWATDLGFLGVACPITGLNCLRPRSVRRFGSRGQRRARVLVANVTASQRLNAELMGRTEARWPSTAAVSQSTLPAHQPQLVIAQYLTLANGGQNGRGGMGALIRWVGHVVSASQQSFQLPSEACSTAAEVEVELPATVDGVSPNHDLEIWCGNPIQQDAARQLYDLREPAQSSSDSRIARDWSRLTAENHIRDMHTCANTATTSTLSPYDAYIRFMNVLDDLRRRIG